MLTWDPKPMHFSQGFPIVAKRTGWKLVPHIRYHSSSTSYATQNGGTYRFLVDKSAALPMEQRFWLDLFANRSDWSINTLFQDWLSTHYEVGGVTALVEQVGLGEMWLKQMATAAASADVSIQYCMPLARHLFEALKLRAVTQIRVSLDGMPNDPTHQWQIGDTAILAWALGTIPFKVGYAHTAGCPSSHCVAWTTLTVCVCRERCSPCVGQLLDHRKPVRQPILPRSLCGAQHHPRERRGHVQRGCGGAR